MASTRKRADSNPLKAVYAQKSRAVCSAPLFRYLKRQRDIFDLFFFVVQLADGADKSRLIAARALAASGNEKDIKQLADIEADPKPALRHLQHHARLQVENLLIRSVDNFLSYLSDAIHIAMENKPELLRSKEEISLEELLDFNSFDDLISNLIDRKVTRLAYQGIDGLSEFIETRLGMKLCRDEQEQVLLTVAVELRNIYTHNRGLVSDITLKRLQKIEHGFEFKKGRSYHADFDELAEFSNNMALVANRLDTNLSKKFNLKRNAYSTHERRKTQSA
jgi:hypothetical protein